MLSSVADSGGYSLVARVSQRGGLSCCGAQDSVVVTYGLQSAGSFVEAHRLSCPVACGILPDQGSN